jgi:hypothetical protein
MSLKGRKKLHSAHKAVVNKCLARFAQPLGVGFTTW